MEGEYDVLAVTLNEHLSNLGKNHPMLPWRDLDGVGVSAFVTPTHQVCPRYSCRRIRAVMPHNLSIEIGDS